ncbi:LysR family transcriptional regulator [Celerinatantimonas sp. MCCC 1A17872]|uniref:LysR family transcriptional regulator n=1 Tax=Celerinatantimonas sp. MCCC 1A17872 TaxID=3177514 RepID=UPI0038C129D8
MVEYISDLRLLLAISRTLNFRQAGEQLGYSPAVVTHRIQRLEALTGKTLFIRSTRHIKLTEEGTGLVSLAEQVLKLTEKMNARGSSFDKVTSEQLKGTVRLSAPHSFARLFLLEPIKMLMQKHPQLSIDLVLEDSLSKLIEEGIDISFRVGGHDETHVDAVPLLKDQRIMLASPEYLREHPQIKTPHDLKQHVCLSYPHLRQWTLSKDKKTYKIALESVMFCNTGDYLTYLAMRGAGVTIKSQWAVQQELADNRLVQILPQYTIGEKQTVKALFPHRDYLPERISYVLDFIRDYIRQQVPHDWLLE